MTTEVAPAIQTKWGIAKVWNTGYYTISDNKKGHYKKLLHRLIFEDFYKIKLPSNIIIHHDDEDKLNNEIGNLVPMTRKEHVLLHNNNRGPDFYDSILKGENHPFYGKHHTEESKRKISEASKGIRLSEFTKTKMSANKNTTGFYCVSTKPCPKCNLGFSWIYQYYDENMKKKVMHSVDLLTLKNKVVEKGLLWKIMDIDNAKNLCNKYDYALEDLV